LKGLIGVLKFKKDYISYCVLTGIFNISILHKYAKVASFCFWKRTCHRISLCKHSVCVLFL